MAAYVKAHSESCSLGRERKLGGTFHLKLNTNSSPIANKYREGKVQSTLERELNVPETAVMQAYGTCARSRDLCVLDNGWCIAGRMVGAHFLFILVMRISSLGICQHGFFFGQKLDVNSPSGGLRLCGLKGDCHLRTRAFSSLVLWKRSHSYWYGCVRQGVLRCRLSSLCWPARRHTTRLETRTKESIHMCEYVSSKLVCVMKVTVGI